MKNNERWQSWIKLIIEIVTAPGSHASTGKGRQKTKEPNRQESHLIDKSVSYLFYCYNL